LQEIADGPVNGIFNFSRNRRITIFSRKCPWLKLKARSGL
jgi:hypothetical protein